MFGRFIVPRPVHACYVELEEPEAITKRRLERIYMAQDPPDENFLWLLSRNDLYRLKLLPRDLVNGHLGTFSSTAG